MKRQTAKCNERVERLRKMLAKEQLDTRQIAARLGCTTNTALKIARQAGVTHLVDKRSGPRAFSRSDF